MRAAEISAEEMKLLVGPVTAAIGGHTADDDSPKHAKYAFVQSHAGRMSGAEYASIEFHGYSWHAKMIIEI
jgi:hypothetical protein